MERVNSLHGRSMENFNKKLYFPPFLPVVFSTPGCQCPTKSFCACELEAIDSGGRNTSIEPTSFHSTEWKPPCHGRRNAPVGEVTARRGSLLGKCPTQVKFTRSRASRRGRARDSEDSTGREDSDANQKSVEKHPNAQSSAARADREVLRARLRPVPAKSEARRRNPTGAIRFSTTTTFPLWNRRIPKKPSTKWSSCIRSWA
jgi:hypothetical protein